MKIENFSEEREIAEDLERVGAEVERVKNKIEQEDPSFYEVPERKREVVKRSVQKIARQEIEKAEFSEDISKNKKEEIYLPNYMNEEDISEEVKMVVEGLIQIALSKSISKALQEARRYSPFIQDAFHDALVDKLIPELEKRGKI